jgi:hypothetical protein
MCARGRSAVEEACTCGRAVMTSEEASSGGVDDGGGDWQSREHAAGT